MAITVLDAELLDEIASYSKFLLNKDLEVLCRENTCTPAKPRSQVILTPQQPRKLLDLTLTGKVRIT